MEKQIQFNMEPRNHRQLLFKILIFVLAFSPGLMFGKIPNDKNIYIHPEFGNNENTGSKEREGVKGYLD